MINTFAGNSLPAALFLLLSTAMPGIGLDFYVSPAGNDQWSGSAPEAKGDGRTGPFRSLTRARRAVRERKKAPGLPPGGVTVWLAGGDYFIETSFTLGKEDGGSPEAPVTWRALPGAEVRLVGGRRIPPEAFQPLAEARAQRVDPAARPHILTVSLHALGLEDLGAVPDLYRGAALLPELFFDGKRMQLARWPNRDWAEIAKIIDPGTIPRNGSKARKPGTFQYAGDRPRRWLDAPGVWLHGYWCFDWYDEVARVGKIDPDKKQITLAGPVQYGIRQGNPPPRRWRAVNLLEELDAPGEYYIDRKNGLLYFYPPAPMTDARILISTLREPVIRLADASHLRLRGLTVEAAQGDGIVVENGADNAILACTVRNVGRTGIRVAGGRSHRVEACDIHDTGTLGIRVAGGDRKTLTPGRHEVVNNHIYRFSRRQRTYASGIQVGGVGQHIAHNLLHNAPHQAIGLGGNDHVIEYNIIHHVCLETDDCGAFYKGRNPSCRGNILRYNFWHHIGSPRGHGNNAVYFDDGDGGDTVFGNIFFRCGEPGRGNMGAVFSHGGHDLLIENNIFIACKRAIGASPWNDKRWEKMLAGKLWQTRLLKAVDITKPPYTTRYPELQGFMHPDGRPRRSRAVRNLAVMCGEFIRGNFDVEQALVMKTDPGFVDMAHGDFALRPESVVFRKMPGFQPLPFDRMGLVKNELRPNPPRENWDYPPPTPLPPPPRRAHAAPARPPKPKTGPRPRVKPPRVATAVVIDGAVEKTEWARAVEVTIEQDLGGYLVKPASRARLAHDGNALLIACENPVRKGTVLNKHTWGHDAVEIAFRVPTKGKKSGPIRVFRGYPDGHFTVEAAADGKARPAPAAPAGVRYAAKIVRPDLWTAEWRIPFEPFGVHLAKTPALPFNITVRRAAQNLWLMWESTRGNSYKVDQAGTLILAP